MCRCAGACPRTAGVTSVAALEQAPPHGQPVCLSSISTARQLDPLLWVEDTEQSESTMDDPDVFGDISRMHQKQITIHAGDEGLAETGRVLYVEPDWTTDDLLQAAGRRLDLVSTPKRMFNCNGKLTRLVQLQATEEV